MSDEEQPRPLRRTIVTLSGAGLAAGWTVITDDQGRFQFSGLAAGQYGLMANKEGFVPRSFGSSRRAPTGRGSAPPPAALSLRSGESRTITIRLPHGAVISGTVTDMDGQPLEGVAMVAMVDRFDPTTGARRLSLSSSTGGATTDDRGMYRIFGLAAGAYVIYAQTTMGPDGPVLRRSGSEGRRVIPAPIYYPSTPDAGMASRVSVAAGEERNGVDVQVQYVPTATISGVVSGDDTAGLANSMATVVLTRVNDAPGTSIWVGATTVGADGQFMFHGVLPGRYTLRTESRGPGGGSPDGPMKWGATEVVVNGEDLENIGIRLLPTLSVSGKVVFDGTAPPPATGTIRTTLPLYTTVPVSLPNPTLQLSDDGRFTISGLTPDTYRPQALGGALRGVQAPIGTSSGSWWVKSIVLDSRELFDSPLEISHDGSDAVVTLTDQASAVAGAVKDASGDPAAGALVVIFSADRKFWFVNSRRVVGVRTDAQGRYTTRNLPPGDYRAIVAQDLDLGEWYDADVLQRLLPAAVPFTISGIEATTVDLVIR